MPTNTSGGTTTSFSNTPQATDDGWTLEEDYSTVTIFDVMADDLGGKAKILWSLDDGTNQVATQTLTSADLLTQDIARAECLSNDTSMYGARIWITADGKVGYDAGNLSAAFRAHLNSLAVGETATDTFVYAIRLASGTLSWATVAITYSGSNDGPTITSAAQNGQVVEDGAQSSSGAVTFNDVDLSDSHTATFTAAVGNATALGAFSIAAVDEAAGAANGSVGWSYQLDNDAAQYLGVGETVYESFVVTIDDGHGGTVAQTVTVAILGSNDAVTVVVGDTSFTGAVVENSAETATADDHAVASGTIAFTDVDLSDAHSVSFAPAAGQTALGEFELASVDEAANAAGGTVGWTYTIAESAAQYLGAGQTLTEVYVVSITDNHGSTITQDVTVTITGTNDSVVIVDADTVASGTVVENSADTAGTSDSGVASGTVAFSDVDLIDTHEASFVAVEGQTSLGTFELAPVAEVDGAAGGTVGWTYTIDESAAQYLAAGQSVTETYTVSIIDHHGSTVTQDVTVTITGTNDVPVITIGGDDEAAATLGETDAGLTTSGTLTVSDVDARDTVTTSVTGVSVAGTAGALTNDQLKAMLAITSGAAAADGEDGNIGWTFASGSEAFDYLAVNESLTLTYTLTATDSSGGTDTQTVTITITGTNDAPTVSGPVEASSDEDATADLVVDLLAGADDVDASDEVHVSGLTPTGGNAVGVTVNGDSLTIDQGAYNYLAVGESEVITYSYTVTDGHTGGTVAQTATITITGANDAPTVSAAVEASSDEDATADLVFDLLAGADDVDASDEVHVSGLTPTGGNAVGVTVNGDSLTIDQGAYNYLAVGESEVITYSYTVTDGHTGGTVAQTATITITGANDAPTVAHAIADQSVDEDHAVLFQVPADAFSDVDASDTLTYSATLEGGAALPDWLSFDAATRTFSGTPPQDFNGVLSVSVTASDGDASVSDTFDLTINAVNDAPVNAIAGYSVNEDTPTQLTGLAVGDVDAGSGEIQVTLSVDSGALSATSGGGVAVSGSGSGTIELTGTAAAINAFLAAATAPTFTPAPNASGDVSLTMTTTDNGNSGSGGALADTDQVTINVVSVNDAPAGTDAIVTTFEDTAKTLSVSDFGFTDLNDSPANALSAVTITTLPGGGSLTLGGAAVSAGQSVSVADILAGKLVYTPAADANGSTSFNFQVQDDGGTANGGSDLDAGANTLTVNIAAVNDAPVNTIAAYSTSEDTPTQLTGLAVSDVDAGSGAIQVTLSVDSGALSATSGGGVAVCGSGNGTIELTGTAAAINAFLAAATAPTFTPATNSSGNVSLTMTTTDNGNSGSGGALTDTDQVTINVVTVNDAAVIIGDTAKAITEDAVPNTVSGNLDSTDVDGVNDSWQAQTIASANGYGSLTLNATGNWTYTLNNSNGTVNALNTGSTPLTDVFTVRTADGTAQQITVTINGHTDAPPIASPTANDDVLYISSGTNPSTFSLASFLGNDVVNGATFAITGGAATYDAATQTITFSSANPGAFTYSLTNAGGTDSATVNVNVVNVTGNANTVDLSANSYAASYFDMRGGNDIFVGSLVVVGSRGDDRVIGGTDNDTLNTKGGGNVLSGGDGSDDFIITNWAGMTNHITDFEAGTATNTAATALDQLHIDIGASGANVFSVGDNDTVVETGEVVINSTTSFADSAAVQAYIDSQALTQGALFVAFNAQLGHAAVYYDANPSAAGGAVLVAELDSVSTLAAVTNINSGDFVFV